MFAALVWVAACAGGLGHEPEPSPTVILRGTARTPGLPDEDQGREPTTARNADAGSIQCGSTRCTVGRQVCCVADLGEQSIPFCADVPPAGASHEDGAAYKRAAREHAACQAAAPAAVNTAAAVSMWRVLRCDDSGDCGAGEICCTNASSGDLVVGACHGANDDEGCSLAELCRGHSCRTLGSSCPSRSPGQLFDVCSPSNPRVRCGTSTCGPQAPVCCWDAGRSACTRGADCSPVVGAKAPWECTRPGDCGGMTCCITLDGALGSSCRLACDYQVQTPTCERDEQCPSALGMKWRCLPVGTGPTGVKRCQY